MYSEGGLIVLCSFSILLFRTVSMFKLSLEDCCMLYYAVDSLSNRLDVKDKLVLFVCWLVFAVLLLIT